VLTPRNGETALFEFRAEKIAKVGAALFDMV
jgi:hypothetical protein